MKILKIEKMVRIKKISDLLSQTYTLYYIKRPLKFVYNILYSILEVFSYSMNLTTSRIVGLEEASHTIQLGMFPSVREVRTSPYHMILIDMYGFVF